METTYDSTMILLYSVFINCIDLNHPIAAVSCSAGTDRSTLSGVEVNLLESSLFFQKIPITNS